MIFDFISTNSAEPDVSHAAIPCQEEPKEAHFTLECDGTAIWVTISDFQKSVPKILIVYHVGVMMGRNIPRGLT